MVETSKQGDDVLPSYTLHHHTTLCTIVVFSHKLLLATAVL
jgi:hypothetical protein